MLSPELDRRADRFFCGKARCVERGESERGDGVLALQTAEHRRAVVWVVEPRAARRVQPSKLLVERARQAQDHARLGQAGAIRFFEHGCAGYDQDGLAAQGEVTDGACSGRLEARLADQRADFVCRLSLARHDLRLKVEDLNPQALADHSPYCSLADPFRASQDQVEVGGAVVDRHRAICPLRQPGYHWSSRGSSSRRSEMIPSGWMSTSGGICPPFERHTARIPALCAPRISACRWSPT